MHVLVTGASGLVGRAVVRALLARGDTVVALSRDPDAHAWPSGVHAVRWDARSPLPRALERMGAVLNLAGESVVGTRWTKAVQARLRDSRTGVTRHLVEWIAAQPRPPPLVSASAAGYYGHDAEGPCPESRPAGSGPLAQLALDWEAQARRTPGPLVVLRLGHVLSPEGGYLGNLLPFARRHLAGRIAGGRQPMAWVHLEDAAAAFLWALDHPGAGTFNVVSPGAAWGTQREFAAELARTLGKRGQVPVPLALIRLRFGAGAGPALAGGQDLRSDALLACGFRFRHAGLREALADLLP